MRGLRTRVYPLTVQRELSSRRKVDPGRYTSAPTSCTIYALCLSITHRLTACKSIRPSAIETEYLTSFFIPNPHRRSVTNHGRHGSESQRAQGNLRAPRATRHWAERARNSTCGALAVDAARRLHPHASPTCGHERRTFAAVQRRVSGTRESDMCADLCVVGQDRTLRVISTFRAGLDHNTLRWL